MVRTRKYQIVIRDEIDKLLESQNIQMSNISSADGFVGGGSRDLYITSAAVGIGKQNTQFIVERLKHLGESGRAAQLCDSLNYGGFNDWFLPSKDELALMYRNLKQKELGGFSNTWYWSSSQRNSSSAWGQRFSDGQQSYGTGDMFSVRAVRAF